MRVTTGTIVDAPVPASRTARRAATVVVVATGLNIVNNVVLDEPAYVVVNVASAGVLVALARSWGLSWGDLALDRRRTATGMAAGVLVAALVAVVVVSLAAVPSVRDALVAAGRGRSGDEVLWAVVVRIPLGTVVPEEVLFRSVLLGVLLRRLDPVPAMWGSALPFGLWHVLPTLDGTSAVSGGIATVMLAVVATTVAGFGFAWLRVRTGSLLTPCLAHLAVNAVALLVAFGLARAG